MKILSIFLITLTLWCVIAKEQNQSNISSEKVVKTEEKVVKTELTKTEVKSSKKSEKVVNSEKNPSDISDPNIGNLFPVTTFNVNLKSLSAHEVHINKKINF